MNNKPVIIIGAGITGLSAAWYLEKRGFTNITVFEAASRVGGKIETLHEDGFLIEKGPDSFIITKPDAINLVHELGLEDELITPKTNRFLILKDDKLISTPQGLSMMVPTDLFAFLASRFFSWPAKHRILQESTVRPNLTDADEPFADFIERRFGLEMLDLYASPLFTGIYATPAEELSLNATFPMFKKMEREYGSLSRAVKKQPKPTGTGSRSTFMGLRNGLASLSDTMVSKLKHTRICLNTGISKITREGVRTGEANDKPYYKIETTRGEFYPTQDVIITIPTRDAQTLLKDIAPAAALKLGSFTCSSSRIVTLAYPKDAVSDPLLATGYVAAAREKNYVSASTWLSSKWEGRAKDGYVLLRCFFGRKEESATFSNDLLIQTAHIEMSKLLGIKSQPEYYWVQRWENALPQYKVGHLDKTASLKTTMKPFTGIHLAGSYLSGVGLPDCIRQGREAAEII
jgi:oxygen-dependent protoporphyrinogen oxidase